MQEVSDNASPPIPLITLFLPFSLPFSPPVRAPTDKALRRAQAARDADAWARVISAAPSDANAIYHFALSLERAGRVNEAIGAWRVRVRLGSCRSDMRTTIATARGALQLYVVPSFIWT